MYFFFLLLQGLVKDAADFHKKQVKMNTRQLYTQQKYNLFRVRTAQHSVSPAGGPASHWAASASHRPTQSPSQPLTPSMLACVQAFEDAR